MKRFLANWEVKVLAIIAAMIFWFFVVGTENTFYSFPDPVEVKAFNLSDELVVSKDLGTVKLRLKVNNENVKGLVPEDFEAYVDLEGLLEGERDVEVVVSSKKTDVSVIKVEPAKITVKIEGKVEKEVDIDYEITGDPAEGYEIEDVILSDDRAVIKGSSELLEDVDKVTLFIELNGENEDINKFYPLKVLDEDGNEIQEIILEEQEGEVEIKIIKASTAKTVGIRPNIIGTPQNDVFIQSIEVEPKLVSLTGDSGKLKDIEFVTTQEINVNDIDEDEEIVVEIIGIPSDVNIEGDIYVTVKIDVDVYEAPAESSLKRKTLQVPVLIRKFKADQTNRKLENPTITLIVEGEDRDLKKVNTNMEILLDITDFSGGN
jgi:YbbR domain-containing protein